MSIKYSLKANKLTVDPNDQVASVKHDRALNIEDIINIMIDRGSTITKADTLSVIEEFFRAITWAIQQGFSINTELFNIFVSIKGVFTDELDRFDSSRHEARLNLQAGVRLKKTIGSLTFEKIRGGVVKPELIKYDDIVSETKNSTITPGGAGVIIGSDLKIDTNDADEGVYLIAADNTTTKVTQYIRNKPSELAFMIPAGLASGTYRLEVRSKMGSKTLQTGDMKGLNVA